MAPVTFTLGYALSISDGCFALSLPRLDEIRVSPGVGVFLLGSLSLSSDVDLPVEGLFAFSSGRLIVRILRPGSSMAFLMASFSKDLIG